MFEEFMNHMFNIYHLEDGTVDVGYGIKKRTVKNNYKQKIHLANQKKNDSDEKNAFFVKLSLKSNPTGIGLCE